MQIEGYRKYRVEIEMKLTTPKSDENKFCYPLVKSMNGCFLGFTSCSGRLVENIMLAFVIPSFGSMVF